MTALNSMANKLAPLGLYEPVEGSAILSELSAYAAALDHWRGELNTALRERFIGTAEDEGLSIREKIFGRERNDLTVEERREMLALRQSVSDNDFTRAALKKFLDSFGVPDFLYSEIPESSLITICVGGSYSDAQVAWIKHQIELILPAHIESYIYFGGRAWSAWDNAGETFAALDSLNKSWQQIDLL